MTYIYSRQYLHVQIIFPQLQLFGHNSQLYSNLSSAAAQVYGVLAIAVLIQVNMVINLVNDNIIIENTLPLTLCWTNFSGL